MLERLLPDGFKIWTSANFLEGFLSSFLPGTIIGAAGKGNLAESYISEALCFSTAPAAVATAFDGLVHKICKRN